MIKPKLLLFLFGTFILFSCASSDDSPTHPIDPEASRFKVTTFGGSKNDSAQQVIATTDGGYAIVGYTQSNDGDASTKQNESFDYWVLKFDANNTLHWSNTYGGSGDDRGNDIIQNSDGSFTVLGYSQSNNGDVSENAGLKDYWVSKISATGDLLWQKSFGYAGNDNGISVISTSDQGLLLTGVLDVTASNGEGNSRFARHAGGDYWAIKLNPNGETEWRNYYGGTYTDTPYDVIETRDGNYIMVGSSDSFDVDISNNKGTYDFWVTKISNSGELLWEKNFGGAQIDSAYGILATSDGSYMIIGDSWSTDQDVTNPQGASDLWLIKITTAGTLLWEKSFGGSNFDAGRSISTSQSGGFLLAGSSRSQDGIIRTNRGQNDALILKITEDGILEWQETIGGSGIDFAYSITQLNNGNIVCVGDSTSADFDIETNKGYSDLLILTQ